MFNTFIGFPSNLIIYLDDHYYTRYIEGCGYYISNESMFSLGLCVQMAMLPFSSQLY